MQDEVSSADSVTNGRPIHNRNPEAGNPRQCWLWLGERSRAQQRKTAAERREVLRNGVVWRCSAHEATGRNRANTGAQGKKIPTDKGWDFGFWWCSSPLQETALPHRRGLHRRYYIRIRKPEESSQPPAHFLPSLPLVGPTFSTPAPCSPFRKAADTWGWMSDYLIVQGQPLTTNRPSSRIRHSTSLSGTSTPSMDELYRSVR